MTDEERWNEIEECFNSIVLDIENRCYADRSVTGAMYMALVVRRHLSHMDKLLLEALAETTREVKR